MNPKLGDYVRHPSAPEWGMGFIQSIDAGGDLKVIFSRVGEKYLRPSKMPSELTFLPGARETALAYHKEFVEGKGKKYLGIRPAGLSRIRRVTHCYSCKQPLDNAFDVECVACDWILCHCGACGCGYQRVI